MDDLGHVCIFLVANLPNGCHCACAASNIAYWGDIRVILGLFWGDIRIISGVYWDNGKGNGHYYSIIGNNGGFWGYRYPLG